MKFSLRTLTSTALFLGGAVLMTTGAFAADAAAGKAIYTAKCKTCHGETGAPPAAMAKAMGVKGMAESIAGKSDDAIKEGITKGVGKMKAQAVAGADLDNVVAYVKSLK